MSNNENEQNQVVKSLGVISTLLLLIVCGLIMAPVWNGSPNENDEKAMRRAEGLAYQVMDIHKAAQKNSRTPASSSNDGHIGMDPWGQPYRYRVLKNVAKTTNENPKYNVVVWSSGPNKRADTRDANLDSDRDDFDAKFDGDDVGVVVVGK